MELYDCENVKKALVSIGYFVRYFVVDFLGEIGYAISKREI